MTIQEAQELIKGFGENSSSQPQIWADLGCGSGIFTKALAGLLPTDSTIFAIDKQPQNLPAQFAQTAIHFQSGDFLTDSLSVPPLDGILMANALHYVSDKKKLIRALEGYFGETGQFLIVEYDTQAANPWVPFPIDLQSISSLFADLGYDSIKKLGARTSIYGPQDIYSVHIY